MSEWIDILVNPAFWVAVLRIATPLILGTLGVLWCERAGVLNLGIEGIMVAGALAGWLSVYMGLPLWGGVAVAALTGAAFGPGAAFSPRYKNAGDVSTRASMRQVWTPVSPKYWHSW